MLNKFPVENLRNMLVVMAAMQQIIDLIAKNMMTGVLQSSQFNPRETNYPWCHITDRITFKDGEVVRHPNGNVVKYIVSRIYDPNTENEKEYTADQIQKEIDSRQ